MEWDAEEREGLRRGAVRFRAGDYFAAHDDWEEAWQGMHGRRRTFWQAMIQLAVGAYHLKNGNRKGCTSLWGKALHKCSDLATMYDGNVPEPVTRLADLLQICLASLHQDDEPWSHLTSFADVVLSAEWFTLR